MPVQVTSLFRFTGAALLAFLVIGGAARAQLPDAAREGFALRDELGRVWRNDAVRFAISSAQLAQANAGHALVGPNGKPVIYQILPAAGGSPPRIAFAADLDPYETRVYRFDPSQSAPATDILVTETDREIRIVNGRTGIAIRKHLAGSQGPIAGVRLNSGTWAGDSRLPDGPAVSGYRATVLSRGPLIARVACAVAFANGGTWQIEFQLQAHEPVVLVNEKFRVPGGTSFDVSLSRHFSPDTLYYRFGKGMDVQHRVGRLARWPLPRGANAPVFVIEPWLHWWRDERQGNWVALYNATGADLLTVATLSPATWVEPGRIDQQVAAQTFVFSGQEGVVWHLPLLEGSRKWLLAALDKDASLAPLNSDDLYQAPLPQQYQIKYSDFPLDRVKDYVLHWDGEAADSHPRLLLTKKYVAGYCAGFRPDVRKLALYRKQPLSPYAMDEPIAYALCTGDPELTRRLCETAVTWLQQAVDVYVRQGRHVSLGFAPHEQTQLIIALNLADSMWNSPLLSPALRERLKAQIALLGYIVDRDDFWSPPRGFSANPNMSTTVAAFRVMLGAMIPSHPMAAKWVNRGLDELRRQLNDWSDADGGWLEAPQYAVVAYDYLLGAFLAAHNAGLGEDLYAPRMKKVAEWLAKISTPPDPDLTGHRHLPPIGNTLIRSPTGEFALLAALWQERDLEFARMMKWMDLQQGSPPNPAIGGFLPMFAGVRSILRARSVVPAAPTFGSEFFPKTGVVLRAHFPSARETQLYLIAGDNHQHYDQDSGSITLWGKGRLIADDFGYEGYMPAEDHSMVVAGSAPGPAIMHVEAFSPGPLIDYVRASKGGWTRDIVFVKDRDPLGANYVVIADRLKGGEPAVWRLWLTADAVTTGAASATAVGTKDVDTDVFVIGGLDGPLSTEHKTRLSWGITDGKYGRAVVTQTGLIAKIGGTSGMAAVVYPRLKDEPAPEVVALNGGKAIEIRGKTGTDFVMLSRDRFTFRRPEFKFTGTVGFVRVRHDKSQAALGAPGEITMNEQTLKVP
jgi:hypothetical protein